MVRDTHPDAARIRWEALARLPPEERLREALALSEAVQELARLGIARRSASRQFDPTLPSQAPSRT